MKKTILEDSRGLQEATLRARALEAAKWDRPALPRCRSAPSGDGPCLSASGMFLNCLLRPHLRHSLSRFDLRAHIAPSRL
jgi:hypothetical protein